MQPLQQREKPHLARLIAINRPTLKYLGAMVVRHEGDKSLAERIPVFFRFGNNFVKNLEV